MLATIYIWTGPVIAHAEPVDREDVLAAPDRVQIFVGVDRFKDPLEGWIVADR